MVVYIFFQCHFDSRRVYIYMFGVSPVYFYFSMSFKPLTIPLMHMQAVTMIWENTSTVQRSVIIFP